MKQVLAGLAATLVLLGVHAPAHATTVLWQQTFAPDPSGQTSVPIGAGFSLAAPSTSAALYVQGGTFATVQWSELATYSIYIWDQFPQDSGNWVLTEDSTYDLGAYTILTQPTVSSFRFDANDYDACYGADYHAEGVICSQQFAFGSAGVDGALVNANRSFTLTLTTGVPEPATWAMIVGGFGLLGAALRRRLGARALAPS